MNPKTTIERNEAGLLACESRRVTYSDIHFYGELFDYVDRIAELAPVGFRPIWQKIAKSTFQVPSTVNNLLHVYNSLITMGSNALPLEKVFGRMNAMYGSPLAVSWAEHVYEYSRIGDLQNRPFSNLNSWLSTYYYARNLSFIRRGLLNDTVPVPWLNEFFCDDSEFVTDMLTQLSVIFPGPELYRVLGQQVMSHLDSAPSKAAWVEYLGSSDRPPLAWWYSLMAEKFDFLVQSCFSQIGGYRDDDIKWI